MLFEERWAALSFFDVVEVVAVGAYVGKEFAHSGFFLFLLTLVDVVLGVRDEGNIVEADR